MPRRLFYPFARLPVQAVLLCRAAWMPLVIHALCMDPEVTPGILLTEFSEKIAAAIMVNKTVLKIGDVSFSIVNSKFINDWEIDPAYFPFVTTDEPDILLKLVRGEPQNGDAKKFFGSYPIWDLYRSNGMSIIKFYDDMPGLSRSLVFENHLEKAVLYFPDATDQFIHPFYGPVLELLMINYLAQQRGTIIHSCGLKHGDKGFLFVGESGAGKSTLTRLWKNSDDVEILSDDRTIVRKKDGAYWIFGTPWHGEAKFGSPQSVRLDRIYFIQHGAANLARKMSGAEPVQNLLTCSFPPYWDTEGMEFTMDFFSDLTASVPCHELLFRPDTGVVDYVKSHDRVQELPGKIADKKILAHGSRLTAQGHNAKSIAQSA